MKNTDLVKVKGILKYREELNKVKPLSEDKYTIKEAAEYFCCASSQVKGYLNNYKDMFSGYVMKEMAEGKSKEVIIISQIGMYYLALLLGRKSRISEKVFNIVNSLYLSDSTKIQQISIDEVTVTKCAEENVSTDNVMDFNVLKEKKTKKEEMIEIPVVETTEDGPVMSKRKVTKSEYEEGQAIIKERMAKFFENIEEQIKAQQEEKEEETCNCTECLKEELNEAMHQSNMLKVESKTTMDIQIQITKSYKDICNILGIDDLDASILIQDCITNNRKNLDKDILSYLVETKNKVEAKRVGSLHYSMELLAIEKFNESKEDAYLHFVNEMKYVIGKDLTELVVKHDYNNILTRVVKAEAFDDAQSVIFTLISE